MPIVMIAIYCLLVGLCVFGLTFYDELRKERPRKEKPSRLIVIEGGKQRPPRLHRRA